MSGLSLRDRMLQVEDWLGVVATRPLIEADYELAHTKPTSWKRAFDGFTYGATYMVRHSQRNLEKGKIAKGVCQALPVPLLGIAVIVVPVSTCFTQRLGQKRTRSEEATRENSIAFELLNACKVAKLLARDDQVRMLKTVYGTSRRDVVAWACICLSLICKTLRDVEQTSDRVKTSCLIRRHARKAILAVESVREQYEEKQPSSSMMR